MHPIKQRILEYEKKYGFNLEARRAFNQAIQGGGNPFSWFGNKVKSWFGSKPSNSATYTKSDLFKSPDVTDTNKFTTQPKHKQNEKRLYDPAFNESPLINETKSFRSPFINPNYNKSSNPFINPNYNKSTISSTPQRHQRNQQNFINPQNKTSTPRTPTTPITRTKTDPDLIDLTKIRQIPAHKFQRTSYSTKKPNIINLSKFKNLPSNKQSQTSYVTNNPETIDLSKINKSTSRVKPPRLHQRSTSKPKPKQRFRSKPKQKSGQHSTPRFVQPDPSKPSKPLQSTKNPNIVDLGTAYPSINSRKRSAPPHLQPQGLYLNVWYFPSNSNQVIRKKLKIRDINRQRDKMGIIGVDFRIQLPNGKSPNVAANGDKLSLMNIKPKSESPRFWRDAYFFTQSRTLLKENVLKNVTYTFATKPTKGDGNCLIYAILQSHLLYEEIPFIKTFISENSAVIFDMYGTRAVLFLKHKLSELAEKANKPKRICDNLLKMGEWLGDNELPTIAEIMKINIFVLNTASGAWSFYGDESKQLPKVYILNIGHSKINAQGHLVGNGIHYETLLPKESLF